MLDRLIESSPVPIKFVDAVDNPYWCGIYYQGETKGYTGKARIEILAELDNCQKMSTVVHEIGHAQCDARDCKCMKNSDYTEREIHAYKFTLSWLLKHKQKKTLKQEIYSLRRQASGDTCSEYYTKAAKYIMKLKLWQKCLDYVK
ncbi:hypothetical protein LCGC14_0948810 [marine sediment metagenome]|uniref:IrrE N-terminal-like domain-containing protein n=1 Tax=marine sediment metagenome TaxID=412755 RepID=A0A0F9NHY7_9ZZZZ